MVSELIIWWVITKTGVISWVISVIYGSFPEANELNGDIFEVAKISNIFWGMPDISDILGVNSRYRVQADVGRKYESTQLHVHCITYRLIPPP